MAAEDCVDNSGFGTLFAKNVPHILEKIFFSLDYESYNTCLKVSKVWNKLLTSEPYKQKGRSLFHDNIWRDECRLHLATIDGDKAEFERLLSHCLVDVNREPTAPLRIAARKGNKDVVQLLLDRGADPNKANEDGRTPLHLAQFRGYTDIVKILQDHVGGA